MTSQTRGPRRRAQALSRDRIVAEAIALLDAAGEAGLTFRALTERLATGNGAVYWHVANKSELLAAATGTVVAAALAPVPNAVSAGPGEELHAVALGLYDAVDDHPWLATQLSAQLASDPTGPLTVSVFESIGRRVRALAVPRADWFSATSALVHYIVGASSQNAANTRGRDRHLDRGEALGDVARTWASLDPDEYPFVRAVADQARDHDDREQFRAGVTVFLAGLTSLHPPGTKTSRTSAQGQQKSPGTGRPRRP